MEEDKESGRQKKKKMEEDDKESGRQKKKKR